MTFLLFPRPILLLSEATNSINLACILPIYVYRFITCVCIHKCVLFKCMCLCVRMCTCVLYILQITLFPKSGHTYKSIIHVNFQIVSYDSIYSHFPIDGHFGCFQFLAPPKWFNKHTCASILIHMCENVFLGMKLFGWRAFPTLPDIS